MLISWLPDPSLQKAAPQAVTLLRPLVARASLREYMIDVGILNLNSTQGQALKYTLLFSSKKDKKSFLSAPYPFLQHSNPLSSEPQLYSKEEKILHHSTELVTSHCLKPFSL